MTQFVSRAISVARKQSFNYFGRQGFHLSSKNMVIAVGDQLPAIDLYEDAPSNKVNIAEVAAGQKIIIFGVPGAFTPGCSKTHLPGYITRAEEFKDKGISSIYCVSINDPFVMAAWGKHQGADGKVRMLADTNGDFTKALDVEVDLAVLGGTRSKRYSMVVDNGIIKELNIEPDNTGLSCSLADRINA